MTQDQKQRLKPLLKKLMMEVKNELTEENGTFESIYKLHEIAITNLGQSIRILLNDKSSQSVEIRKKVSALRDQLEYIQLDLQKMMG